MPLLNSGENLASGLGGLEQAKTIKLQEINNKCEVVMSTLTATYPPSEVRTFDKQEKEARGYLADKSTATPLLSSLALSRGLPLDELVRRVIIKADMFSVVSGDIVGQRQKHKDALALCEDITEIQAINVAYTMPEI